MSIGLLIKRPGISEARIAAEEWLQIVTSDGDLRLRKEPYIAVNPVTGETIQIDVGEADSEIHVNGEWLPFLCWRRGDLTTKYVRELEDKNNPRRMKLVAVANQLKAIIVSDAGDEPLAW
jgi:hypothetical protein